MMRRGLLASDKAKGKKVLSDVLEKVQMNVASVDTSSIEYHKYEHLSPSQPTKGDEDEQLVQEDIYYYYYFYDDDKPSDTDISNQMEDQSLSIPDERSCPNSLIHGGETFIQDITFAFAMEFDMSSTNEPIVNNLSSSLLDEVSSTLLHCKSSKGGSQDGIYMVRFPVSEPMVRMSSCTSTYSTSTACKIYKGSFLLVSSQSVTNKEQERALIKVKEYIEGMPVDGKFNNFKYLGPHIQSKSDHDSHNNHTNHLIVGVVSSLAILVALFIAFRGCERRKRYRAFNALRE